MAEPIRDPETLLEGLIEPLREEAPEPPADLAQRTIGKVQAVISAKDLVELATIVFVLRFCAPLIDLLAAALDPGRRPENE